MPDKKLTPFSFIGAINNKKDYDLILESEKEYSPFMTNRALSFHPDCIFFANEINRYSGELTNKMQFDFYYHGLRKMNRWSKEKWKDENLQKLMKSSVFELIRETYPEMSTEKILNVIDLFGETELKQMKLEAEKGGAVK